MKDRVLKAFDRAAAGVLRPKGSLHHTLRERLADQLCGKCGGTNLSPPHTIPGIELCTDCGAEREVVR